MTDPGKRARIWRQVICVLIVGVTLYLTGCSTTPQSLGWTQDMPNFQMKTLEWNVLTGPDARRNLDAMCGIPAWRGNACVVRIIEGGKCVVFSLHTQDEAKRMPIWNEGWSLYDHEVTGHCGGGQQGGWKHD